MYFSSSKVDRVKGKNWYSNAYSIACTLGKKYGVHSNTVSAVISALSPSNKWNRNVEDAEMMLRANAYDLNLIECKPSTYGKQKLKAIAIIEGNVSNDETLKRILSGQKTKSFYANISTNGKTTDCTVDGHAYNIWNGTVTNLNDVPNMTPKTYKMIQEDYRQAAIEISAITESETGEILTASEIQAITWVAYRRIHKNLI
tara:strand:- start:1863 stop:2465 length:603 start_codon:yes stop_codon:yes gene_type:complete